MGCAEVLMPKVIEVTWKQAEFDGYTDVFPVEEFSSDVEGEERTHVVRGPKGGTDIARYRLTVRDNRARIDYTPFSHFNDPRGVVLGVMEFRFKNVSRTQVSELRWDGRVVSDEEASTVTRVTSEAVSAADIVTEQHRRLAMQLARPGQAKFRKALDEAYGARCCISNCAVPLAINAAHVTPFARRQSNATSNGLLLRSDLHALFDGTMCAVHPTTRIVYFSHEALDWPEYRQWHGKAKLRAPQAGHENSAPALAALKARWAEFKRAHGNPQQ
jgi:hypothetical protein